MKKHFLFLLVAALGLAACTEKDRFSGYGQFEKQQ